jgi:hypothetical protein
MNNAPQAEEAAFLLPGAISNILEKMQKRRLKLLCFRSF